MSYLFIKDCSSCQVEDRFPAARVQTWDSGEAAELFKGWDDGVSDRAGGHRVERSGWVSTSSPSVLSSVTPLSTLALSLFCTDARATSAPLHLLSPLSGMLSPRCLHGLFISYSNVIPLVGLLWPLRPKCILPPPATCTYTHKHTLAIFAALFFLSSMSCYLICLYFPVYRMYCWSCPMKCKLHEGQISVRCQ